LPISLPPIWFVGCGNMAGALIAGWRSADVDFSNAIAIRPAASKSRRRHGHRASRGSAAAALRLGSSRKSFPKLHRSLRRDCRTRPILVSMLAGVEADDPAQAVSRTFRRWSGSCRTSPSRSVRGYRALQCRDLPETSPRLQFLFGLLGMRDLVQTRAELAAIGSVAGAGPPTSRALSLLWRKRARQGLTSEVAGQIACRRSSAPPDGGRAPKRWMNWPAALPARKAPRSRARRT
jgi:pyrroline-5-carboxylate reductase